MITAAVVVVAGALGLVVRLVTRGPTGRHCAPRETRPSMIQGWREGRVIHTHNPDSRPIPLRGGPLPTVRGPLPVRRWR